MRRIENSLESVVFELQNILQEAVEDPAPALYVNSQGIIVEYNVKVPSGQQSKFYEKIADFEKNNS